MSGQLEQLTVCMAWALSFYGRWRSQFIAYSTLGKISEVKQNSKTNDI